MKKELLQSLVEEGLSTYKIAEKLEISQTTVRYWLKKNKIKLEKKRRIKDKNGNLKCSYCNEFKETKEFYKKKSGYSNLCKKCSTKYHYENHTNKKKELIKYKGGKCEHCSIISNDENYVIFDFHHLDPNEKEMEVKVVNNSLEKLKKEADKCILLCSNCHRLEHRKLFIGS